MQLDNEVVSDRPSDWIPELHDIPIGLVNKFLYQQDENEEKEEDEETDTSFATSKTTTKTNSKKTNHNNTNNNNYSNNIVMNQFISSTLIDTADEMSEEDALALRRNKYGKRFKKIDHLK